MKRSEIQPGEFFAINGNVFRRTLRGEESDFGGKVGRCFRACRQKMGNLFAPIAAGDPEWIQIKGTAKRLTEPEAEEALWKLEEEAC